jgi:tRNA(Ile)-lysidine synthase
MARAPRAGPAAFGPRWLERRLAQLLPGFPDVGVCVAFSGGADSTALLAAVAQLRPPPLRLRALHIDHRLQPHSGRWSAHCRRIARTLGVPLSVRRARIVRARGESPEAAARAARYRLLGAALTAGEALLTAHHADDQLETVLLQLLRGAGLAGLAAMPAVAPFARGVLVRPLLPLSHAQLVTFVSAERLLWVEDETNAQPSLDRSYLRTRVLPLLSPRWPAAAATVARSARHAAEAQALLDELGAADTARASCGALLSAKVLRRLPLARRRNALRYWIGAAGYLTPPASRLEQIATALLAARADAQPFVAWQAVRVRREADLLSLQRMPAPVADGVARADTVKRAQAAASAAAAGRAPAPAAAAALIEVSWRWRERRTCVLPGRFGTLALERDPRGPLDLAALGPTLTLRSRRGGERLRPVRGGPRRALKSLLQEAHVPLERRARLPLIFDGERLIAAADLWLDESVQAQAGRARRARLVWRSPA